MNTKQTNENLIVSIPEHSSVLMICICGEHKEGHVPLKELHDANVCLHFVDEKDDVLKKWKPHDKELSNLITQSNEEYLWKFLEFDFYRDNTTGHYVYNRNMDKERVDEFIRLQEVK